MWQIILFALVAYFLAILISTLIAFDKLIRLEYNDYRPMWEKDGRPRGAFWNAPENRRRFGINLRSEWAYGRLNFIWLFVTPEWMVGNPQALRLVRRLRVLAFLWNTSFMAIIIILVVLAGKGI
jgi:hypothetical protein